MEELIAKYNWKEIDNSLLKSFNFNSFEAAFSWLEDIVVTVSLDKNLFPNIMWENMKITVIVYSRDSNKIDDTCIEYIKKIEEENEIRNKDENYL